MSHHNLHTYFPGFHLFLAASIVPCLVPLILVAPQVSINHEKGLKYAGNTHRNLPPTTFELASSLLLFCLPSVYLWICGNFY